MDPLSLLAATALVPGMTANMVSGFDIRPNGSVVFDTQAGSGAEAVSGKRVTCEFIVTLPGGRSLHNTEKRGLPFTFVVGRQDVEPLLADSALGMRVGGTRLVLAPPRALPSKLIPARTGLTLRIRLVAVARP